MSPISWTRAATACQRRAASWFGRRPLTLSRGPAIVSFTFDDFPRSALVNGGSTLESFGLAGTFYTSLGLAGQQAEGGPMFALEDLPGLLTRGHELGCHTFDHCPAWETPTTAFTDSVERNRKALQRYVPQADFHTLSYPISYPRPATKRAVAPFFSGCRGGGQRSNIGTVDLNYLSAFFLEQSRDNLAVVAQLIDNNRHTDGWLIFATHDITGRPTRYGCTPGFFKEVVLLAIESGAKILPVGKACEMLRRRAFPDYD